jgi:FkbM family methyltransferase
MANRFRRLLSKFILSTKNNLVSLEKPYQTIAHLLKEHPITGIIDAGASNGSVSRRLLRFFPKADVYAFEPNPLYTERLLAYSREEKRFKPNFKALSDHEGMTKLYITHSPGSTSLFRALNIRNETYSQGMTLKGATNALSNSILLVYTEIIFTPLYQGGALYSEIDLYLRESGFELYDIYGPKYTSKGQLAWANAIFINSSKLFLE